MKQELRIDLLNPKQTMVFLPRKPDGVESSGLRSEVFGAFPAEDAERALHFIVTISKGIAVKLVTDWLYERIKNHGADRVKINGKEPKDRADFDQIVREEIEIGKND